MSKERREYPCFVGTISVLDPDSHGQVELEVYKTGGGGMVAIDASYLERVRTVVPSPFDDDVLLDLSTDDDEHEENCSCERCHAHPGGLGRNRE